MKFIEGIVFFAVFGLTSGVGFYAMKRLYDYTYLIFNKCPYCEKRK